MSLSILLLLWLGLFDILRGSVYPSHWQLTEATTLDDEIDEFPMISILVPARNEEANIETCIRSAMALNWPGALEIIVVNDGSTDRTGHILAELSAETECLRVIEGVDLPQGWLGKPHALHLGQQKAQGEWLWFVDADVILKPNALRLLYQQTNTVGAHMSSVLGQLETKSFWEHVIQTRMAALISGANPLVQVNDPEHERALANGQCIFVHRTAYDELGGHRAIRQSVLDDVDLAKRAKKQGVPYCLFYGPKSSAAECILGLARSVRMV